MSITPEQRQQWREDAERDQKSGFGLGWPARILALLDALDAAEANALREAVDEFDKYDEVTIGHVDIGSNMIPVSPADRLRDRADRIEGQR